MQKQSNLANKTALHQRNKHRHGYDFLTLCQTLPDFTPYVKPNQYNNLSIDFADPMAVKLLNKALLLHYYQLSNWDIPNDYLCPPIPGRADYIHYLADLLAHDNDDKIPLGKQIRVLDIGVGANVIYPIIGRAEYNWSFVGSDINPMSIKIAKLIIQSNPLLNGLIDCRLQRDTSAIFRQIIKPKEFFMLTMCNPPFHDSAQAALASNQTKLKKLGKWQYSKSNPKLNFGGQQTELWCKGGESAFITNMIKESTQYKQQCLWFTSLVSKKESLKVLNKQLMTVKPAEVKIIPMAQGQKSSRFIAWSFFQQDKRQAIIQNHQENSEGIKQKAFS